MDQTNFQKHMMTFIHHNRRLHMPTIPGMGMSVLPVLWARRTSWIGTIIYVTPKALHCQISHEITKRCHIVTDILVGMTQAIPLFAPVIILTPQTLRFRVRELCLIKPRFVVTKSIRTGWDDVRTLCTGAERVCLLGGESTINTRSIVR